MMDQIEARADPAPGREDLTVSERCDALDVRIDAMTDQIREMVEMCERIGARIDARRAAEATALCVPEPGSPPTGV